MLKTKKNIPRKRGSVSTGISPSLPSRIDNCIMLSTDQLGLITQVNAFGEDFLGLNKQALIGRRFSKVVLSEEIEFSRRQKRFINNFIYNSGLDDFGEFETRHVSGTSKRVAWTRSGVRNSKGVVIRMLYIGMDVHMHRQQLPDTPLFSPLNANQDVSAQKCHSRAEDRELLEKYIANSKVWAWELGRDGTFCYASPGVEKLLGYSINELIGVGMEVILPENEKENFKRIFNQAIQRGGKRFCLEAQMLRKNGQFAWSETSGTIFYDDKDIFLGARGLNRDITEEMVVKEELVLKKQEHRYLFDNTQVALFVTSEDGTILKINHTYARIHDRQPEEMVGHKFIEFLPIQERKDAFKFFSDIFHKAKSQKDKFVDIPPRLTRLKTTNGIHYIKLVPKAVKIFENGKMIGLLCTALDATEMCKLQQELEKHQRKLHKLVEDRADKIRSLQKELLRNERLSVLGKLTATVSHEIRNPLGTINSSLYVVSERLKGKGYPVTPAIERGFRAIHRCDNIIEELLDFTRAKRIDKKTQNVGHLLEVLLVGKEVPDNVSIVRNIGSELMARIDGNRFRRCLSNLLDNALETLGEGSGGSIRIDAELSGKHLEICVADNGSGITEKDMANIFEPFYSTKPSGIGLGLPICQQVMELHSGTINVHSNIGEGTTVTLRLPAET